MRRSRRVGGTSPFATGNDYEQLTLLQKVRFHEDVMKGNYGFRKLTRVLYGETIPYESRFRYGTNDGTPYKKTQNTKSTGVYITGVTRTSTKVFIGPLKLQGKENDPDYESDYYIIECNRYRPTANWGKVEQKKLYVTESDYNYISESMRKLHRVQNISQQDKSNFVQEFISVINEIVPKNIDQTKQPKQEKIKWFAVQHWHEPQVAWNILLQQYNNIQVSEQFTQYAEKIKRILMQDGANNSAGATGDKTTSDNAAETVAADAAAGAGVVVGGNEEEQHKQLANINTPPNADTKPDTTDATQQQHLQEAQRRAQMEFIDFIVDMLELLDTDLDNEPPPEENAGAETAAAEAPAPAEAPTPAPASAPAPAAEAKGAAGATPAPALEAKLKSIDDPFAGGQIRRHRRGGLRTTVWKPIKNAIQTTIISFPREQIRESLRRAKESPDVPIDMKKITAQLIKLLFLNQMKNVFVDSLQDAEESNVPLTTLPLTQDTINRIQNKFLPERFKLKLQKYMGLSEDGLNHYINVTLMDDIYQNDTNKFNDIFLNYQITVEGQSVNLYRYDPSSWETAFGKSIASPPPPPPPPPPPHPHPPPLTIRHFANKHS